MGGFLGILLSVQRLWCRGTSYIMLLNIINKTAYLWQICLTLNGLPSVCLPFSRSSCGWLCQQCLFYFSFSNSSPFSFCFCIFPLCVSKITRLGVFVVEGSETRELKLLGSDSSHCQAGFNLGVGTWQDNRGSCIANLILLYSFLPFSLYCRSNSCFTWGILSHWAFPQKIKIVSADSKEGTCITPVTNFSQMLCFLGIRSLKFKTGYFITSAVGFRIIK